MHADVTIAGAGILGLTLARSLAERGVSSVVIEREQAAGTHASGKNAGMFRQLYRDPQLTSWAKRSCALWPDSIRTSCFQQAESVVFGRTVPDHERNLFEEQVVTSPSGSSMPAVITKTDGLIDSPRFMSMLAADFPPKLVRLAFDTRALSTCFEDGRWVTRTEQSQVESPYFVACGGAWSSALPIIACQRNLSLGMQLLQPYARFLFVVSGFPEGYMPAEGCGYFWNEVDEWYLRRWDERTRLFSLCDRLACDPDSFSEREARDPASAGLAASLKTAFPELAHNLTLERYWHCFRTYTPDQLPVWGPDPRQDNLFWLAGFGGFGMSTGFAAADDLADLIIRRNVSVSSSVIVSRLLATE